MPRSAGKLACLHGTHVIGFVSSLLVGALYNKSGLQEREVLHLCQPAAGTGKSCGSLIIHTLLSAIDNLRVWWTICMSLDALGFAFLSNCSYRLKAGERVLWRGRQDSVALKT